MEISHEVNSALLSSGGAVCLTLLQSLERVKGIEQRIDEAINSDERLAIGAFIKLNTRSPKVCFRRRTACHPFSSLTVIATTGCGAVRFLQRECCGAGEKGAGHALCTAYESIH